MANTTIEARSIESRRPPANDTLYRQWLMLREIPRAPKKIDVARIEEALAAHGVQTTKRTIQRDLVSLSQIFPITGDDHKPQGWWWLKDAEPLQLPGIDAQTALALLLVERHLPTALPRAALRHLDPWFKVGRSVLERGGGKGLGAWLERVRVVPRGVPLSPPETNPDVVDVVYDALLSDRCFSAEYKKRGDTKITSYEVCPLGLVIKDAAVYLVCTLFDYDNPLQLALHRMKKAALLEKPRKVPPGFDLDRYIAEGNFGFKLGDDVALRARFDREAAQTLLESPLSPDQTVKEMPDGDLLLEATVPDTVQLRAWLLGYGALVEVLAPQSLRAAIAAQAEAAAARYR